MINDFSIEGTKIYNYYGSVGKATLKHKSIALSPCANYNKLDLNNILECIYCGNCYYEIILENGDKISNFNDNFNIINDTDKLNTSIDYDIIFYDYVPKIDDLFAYLFDENSLYRIVRLSDKVIVNDYFRCNKILVKK